MTPEFLLTFVVVIAPGAGVLYVLGSGLSRGHRAGVFAALGCTVGILPHMTAAILGLAAILHTSAVAFHTLKYLGVVYLLWMAWHTFREHGALKPQAQAGRASDLQVAARAVLVNSLNPKLSIFFLAFLPQFITKSEAHPLGRMLELSAVFMAMTVVVFIGYGLFAGAVRDHVISRPRVLAGIRGTFAATFVALSVKLALADR
jgi:threonine/homoserine/homoserine lactone efflux protein